MTDSLKPLVLLADSSLLFAKGDAAFLGTLLEEEFGGAQLRAAYIGAANGDIPAYFEIFVAAMASVGIAQVHQVSSSFPQASREWLTQADVILLAGGDVALGWEVFATTGMLEVLQERFLGGAMLMGVSAGAIHLSRKGWRPGAEEGTELFDTLGYLPYLVDCHDEANAWEGLKHRVKHEKAGIPGLGLPFGSGLIYHPQGEAQPLGKPLVEFRRDSETDSLRESLLYPLGSSLEAKTQ